MCFNISSKFNDLEKKWDSVLSGNLKPKGVSLASESISNILFSLKNVSADSFSLFPEEFKNKNIRLLNTLLCEEVTKSGFTSEKIEKITSNALAIKMKIEHGPTSRNINKPAPPDLKMALFCDIDNPDHNGATTLDLMTALRTNVPFITTRSILTGKNLNENKNYKDELCSLILDKEDQWEIYQYTKPNNENKELIVFIPKTLTSSKSVEFKSSWSFWEISAKDALKKAKYKSIDESIFASLYDLETLIGLFGEIEKSSQGMLLFMHGHGGGGTSSTAGLNQDKFERFLDGIKGVCRGLIISSCGASGKVSQVYFPKLVNESKVMQKDKDRPIASYNEKLEGLPCWVILKSIGDFSASAGQEAEANLFLFMEKLSTLMQSPGGATIARYKRMLRDVERGKKKRWNNLNRVLFPHSANSPVGLQTACESEKAHPYTLVEKMRKPLERIMRAKIAIQKHLKEIEGINQIEEGDVRIFQEWKALLQDPRTHQDNDSFSDKCYNYACQLFSLYTNRQQYLEKSQEYIFKPAEFLLVDPLIVNETLNFQKNDPILLSMTPDQSQFFLKKIQLNKNTPHSYLRHMLCTYAKKKPFVNKGFFIGKLQYGQDLTYEQIVVNITPERRECIYQEGGDYYHYCPESGRVFHFTPSVKDKNKVIQRISPFEYLLLFRKWQKSTQCDAKVVKRICGGQQNTAMFSESVYSKAFWGEEYKTLVKYQPLFEWMEKTKWEIDYTTKWELKHTTKPSHLKNIPKELKELTKLLMKIDPELLGDLVESSAINILIGSAYQEVFSVAANDMDKYGSLVELCLTKMAEDGAEDGTGLFSGKLTIAYSLFLELKKDITDWNHEFISMLLKFGADIAWFDPHLMWPKLIKHGDLDLLRLVIENASEINIDDDNRPEISTRLGCLKDEDLKKLKSLILNSNDMALMKTARKKGIISTIVWNVF